MAGKVGYAVSDLFSDARFSLQDEAAQPGRHGVERTLEPQLAADALPQEGGEPVTLTVTTPLDYLQALARGATCPTCGQPTTSTGECAFCRTISV